MGELAATKDASIRLRFIFSVLQVIIHWINIVGRQRKQAANGTYTKRPGYLLLNATGRDFVKS